MNGIKKYLKIQKEADEGKDEKDKEEEELVSWSFELSVLSAAQSHIRRTFRHVAMILLCCNLLFAFCFSL